MATSTSIFQLRRKRNDIRDAIASYEAKLREARADLAAVLSTLRLFETSGDPADLTPYRLAVGLVRGAPSAALAAELIATFVTGAILGTIVSEVCGNPQRSVLLFVSGLLALAGGLDLLGLPGSVFMAAGAMGAENAVFSRAGDVQIGLTYMTGTLVKFAQSLAYIFMGQPNTRWISFGLLWAGLVLGAVLGAFAYTQPSAMGFLSAAIMALVLSFAESKAEAQSDR